MIIIDDQLDALYGFYSKTTNIALKNKTYFLLLASELGWPCALPQLLSPLSQSKRYIYHDQLKHENHDDDLCPCISGSLSFSGHRPLQVLRHSHVLNLNNNTWSLTFPAKWADSLLDSNDFLLAYPYYLNSFKWADSLSDSNDFQLFTSTLSICTPHGSVASSSADWMVWINITRLSANLR